MKIAANADVGQYAEEFQRQLYSYLNAFTDGAAGGMVMTLGWEHAFEAWRRYADSGRSRRPEHVHHLMTSVMQPKQVAKLADLDAGIVAWEANTLHWQEVNNEKASLSEGQKRLIFINIF